MIKHNLLKISCKLMFFGTAKEDCVVKAREILNFLPVVNNSDIISLSFFTKHIRNHIIRNNQNSYQCMILAKHFDKI